jgi:hypothetical protein
VQRRAVVAVAFADTEEFRREAGSEPLGAASWFVCSSIPTQIAAVLLLLVLTGSAPACYLVQTTHLAKPARAAVPQRLARTARKQKAPRISFDQTTCNFGAIYQGEKVVHRFTFTNTGETTLTVTGVRSGCECVTAELTKRALRPGESSSVRVDLDSKGYRGSVLKSVWVGSNDPTRPEIELKMSGTVRVEIELSSQGIYVGKVPLGDVVERTVIVRPFDVKSFSILSATSSDPSVTVTEIGSAASPEPRGAYVVTIRCGPSEAARRILAEITLDTNLAHTKQLRLRVYGRYT